MRTALVSLCLLAFTLNAAACSSDDDATTSANAGKGATAGASSGGTSSGGTSGAGDATGGTLSAGASGADTAAGGASSNDTATAGESGTSNTGEAGSSNTPNIAPYANVTAVSVTGSDGAYTFNVTVESADIDCTQFADWWEVLTLDGALVYRRILEHSHTDANGTSDPDAPGNTFTRDGGPVAVAADNEVIVRAHMSVGGYNGEVMRGSVSDGFADAPDIGPDFAADVESAAPQPTGCEF